MIKFIGKSIAFIAIVVGVLGGICAAEISAELRHYRLELAAPDGATVFVCGDSRTEYGLDPDRWPGLFNFSLSGRTPDQTYLTAMDILDANPGRFKTMLIDVSFEGLWRDLSLPLAEMGGPSKYGLVYFLHPDERMRSVSGIVGLFRDFMVGERMKLVSRVIRGRRKFTSSLAGGFHAEKNCASRKDPTRYRHAIDSWCGRIRGLLDNPAGVDAYFGMLGRTIAMARGRGVNVVLITMPWNRDLVARVGATDVERFASTVEAFAKQQGCLYVNAMLENEFPAENWMDANHLNKFGAAQFTAALRERICAAEGQKRKGEDRGQN